MYLRRLCIQVQSGADPALSADELELHIKELGLEPSFLASDNGEQGYNIYFRTETPQLVWETLKNGLFGNPVIGPLLFRSSIVVCEGLDGWKDYLLLHHHEEPEELDDFGL